MKSIESLTAGDYIAFSFKYNGESPEEIIVDNITEVYKKKGLIKEVLVHFLYGHHSLSEFVKKEDILAIGNSEGEGTIKGWGGKYDLLNQKRIDEVLNKDK